jgi:hypothetical protein
VVGGGTQGMERMRLGGEGTSPPSPAKQTKHNTEPKE